jgi:hypothetical protein
MASSTTRVPSSVADTSGQLQGQPWISPALGDDARSAYLGRARIKDVEAKLGACIRPNLRRACSYHLLDTIQGLVQRLVESSKQRSQDIVTRRKRHKRDTKLTAEVCLLSIDAYIGYTTCQATV